MDGLSWLIALLAAFLVGEGSPHLFVPPPDAEVIVMGKTAVEEAVIRVVAMLRDAGRSEGTVRRQRAVLDRFAAFLTGRGLDTASDEVCIDFIANQTGVRLASLREPFKDRDVQAVRRPVVLMADALVDWPVDVDRPVIATRDHCPARFRAHREDYRFLPRAWERRGDRGHQGQGGQQVLGLPGSDGHR